MDEENVSTADVRAAICARKYQLESELSAALDPSRARLRADIAACPWGRF